MDTSKTKKESNIKISIIAIQDQFQPVIDHFLAQDLEGIDCLCIQDQKKLDNVNFKDVNIVFILSDMVTEDCILSSFAVAKKTMKKNILTFYVTNTKELMDTCLNLRKQVNASLILSNCLIEKKAWAKSYALVICRICQQLRDKAIIRLSLEDYKKYFNADIYVDYAMSENTCFVNTTDDMLDTLITPNAERLRNAKDLVAMINGGSNFLLISVTESIGNIEKRCPKSTNIIFSLSSIKEDQFEMLLFIPE